MHCFFCYAKKPFIYIYIYIYIYKSKSVAGDYSRAWPRWLLFLWLLHWGVGEGSTPFPEFLHFTLDPYFIVLTVKLGGIKYHFLSLRYDSTGDWTQVTRATGERTSHFANDPVNIFFVSGVSTKSHLHIYIIIIIIIMCSQHGYPWPSLSTSPYHSSPLVGLQGYIPYHHIAAVCMFELVVLLLIGHMRGSTGVHHLWARPCFSRSVRHVWFV